MVKEFSFLSERTTWPADAIYSLALISGDDLIRRSILYQRLHCLWLSEIAILASIARCDSVESFLLSLELLAGLRLRQEKPAVAAQLIEKIKSHPCSFKADSLAVQFRERQIALVEGKRVGEYTFISEVWDNPLFQLQRFQELLCSGNESDVISFLEDWPSQLKSPEALELQGRALKALGRSSEAEILYHALLSRGWVSAACFQNLIEINYLARRNCGFSISVATRLYPRNPAIASHKVLIELHGRQPGTARRSAFRERLLYSIGKHCLSSRQSDSNLVYAFDHTGRSDLIPYLHPVLIGSARESPPLFDNIVMQLASIASPAYGLHAQEHASCFPAFRHKFSHAKHALLRIGLVSSDLGYHPVGRFIQTLLHNGFGDSGEVYILNTGHDILPRLQQLAGDRYRSLSEVKADERLSLIRELNLDVAIDLAGWTGENNGFLFASGLANVQINYLGYFASTGLSSIDVWIGDSGVFPEPMQEWHSEQIVRLARPFLAWQPDETLPEGRVEVTPAPNGPLTFGCFNHARKLSSSTLRLWASLLKAIPGSRLALKAFSSDDPAVVALLQRRMRSCGLDPDAVIWLPTCPNPEDHLRQYGLIDIALDPFPNGGCTTTCEALWMGVPVITLCGSHYVSRMSTAVLQGASLSEWVAHSKEEYLHIGIQAAKRLDSIRAGREQLRVHLQASPLGDAADLAKQLWRALERLV